MKTILINRMLLLSRNFSQVSTLLFTWSVFPNSFKQYLFNTIFRICYQECKESKELFVTGREFVFQKIEGISHLFDSSCTCTISEWLIHHQLCRVVTAQYTKGNTTKTAQVMYGFGIGKERDLRPKCLVSRCWLLFQICIWLIWHHGVSCLPSTSST